MKLCCILLKGLDPGPTMCFNDSDPSQINAYQSCVVQ